MTARIVPSNVFAVVAAENNGIWRLDDSDAVGTAGVRRSDRVQVIAPSIPIAKQPELADLPAEVSDETVIVDTPNYYPAMNGHIEAVDNGQVESVWSAKQLGNPIVKAWNAALACTTLSARYEPSQSSEIS